MDPQGRPSDDFLTFLSEVESAPHAHGFFSIARKIEHIRSDLPKIGTSKRLKDDPIRFSQTPSLAFATSEIDKLYFDEKVGVNFLQIYFFGLLGPNGPLPLHITEFLRGRVLNEKDLAPSHFLDVLNHRFISLFYRAWSKDRPVCCLDRPAEDAFAERIACLAGHGTADLRDGDSLAPYSKLGEAGLLARPIRTAEGLEDILRRYFRVAVRVLQFAPVWIALPESTQTRLGRNPQAGTLGQGAVVGARFYDAQSHLRIELGPLSYADYQRFFPGRPAHQALRDWLRTFAGLSLSCSLVLRLRARELPSTRLGVNSFLGWNLWLGGRLGQRDADDLKLVIS